jgi:flagellar biosynthesis protein FliR
MGWLEGYLLAKVAIFVLILTRIGALVMTAPLWRMEAVPMQVRGLLAVALSLLVMPLYANHSLPDASNLFTFGKLVANEMLVGLLIGLGMAILIGGIEVAGQIVSQLSGMQLADVVNPAFDSSVSVFTQLFYYVTMAVFVIIGGHRLTLQALLETFAWAPPGQAAIGESYLVTLIGVLTQSFQLGIRAAAPLMIALSVSTLVLALVSRTMPQINIIAVGFGLNSILTISGILLTVGGFAWTFCDPMIETLEALQAAVAARR